MLLRHLTPPYLKALLYYLSLLILELQQGGKGFYFISKNNAPKPLQHQCLPTAPHPTSVTSTATRLEFPVLKQGGEKAAASSTPSIQQLAFS